MVSVSMQPLMEAGLDSLGQVQLRDSLASRFQLDLPATLAFDHPTIAALAAFLQAQLPSAEGRPASLQPSPQDYSRAGGSPSSSAVLGISCRSVAKSYAVF